MAELPPNTPLSCPPPKPDPVPPAPTGRSDLTAYRGLGTWVDVYDWTSTYTKGHPVITPATMDNMAKLGNVTLYIQVAKGGSKNPALIETDTLGKILTRAHANHMRAVAWYLPLFGDVADDYRHLKAAVDFRVGKERFDSVGVDVEWRNSVKDADERSRRLVSLSKQLRAYAPQLPLAGIVMPPVVTDEINRSFWPRFPWASLKSMYDVWQPMDYWTNRSSGSKWRNAYTYTKANVDYLRKDLGDPKAAVHPVAGIGNECTDTDWKNYVKAVQDTTSLGGSSYDYATTKSSAYTYLRTIKS
ncbi:MAG: hypothetical protein QOE64_197 [Frankiales bacterium]|nr:hypothetical protein [Frankiales bacterium]